MKGDYLSFIYECLQGENGVCFEDRTMMNFREIVAERINIDAMQNDKANLARQARGQKKEVKNDDDETPQS